MNIVVMNMLYECHQDDTVYKNIHAAGSEVRTAFVQKLFNCAHFTLGYRATEYTLDNMKMENVIREEGRMYWAGCRIHKQANVKLKHDITPSDLKTTSFKTAGAKNGRPKQARKLGSRHPSTPTFVPSARRYFLLEVTGVHLCASVPFTFQTLVCPLCML